MAKSEMNEMIAVQQILVATDFSEISRDAIEYATQLAESFCARLHVLHVVEEPFGYVADTRGFIPEVDAFRETLNQAARSQLHTVLTPEEIQRWQAHLALRTGTPYAEIVRYAKDHAIDLIVIGTHGRGPFGHFLLGSVAEKVVRYADCPVLTVRQPRSDPTVALNAIPVSVPLGTPVQAVQHS